MADPVVHFEIIGTDPDRLREFYSSAFGWTFDVGAPVAGEVSDPARYGFVDVPDGAAQAIPGGVGGGEGYRPHVTVYVGVDDVSAAITRVLYSGGRLVFGPVTRPDGALAVACVRDPEGNVVGLAGPPA